jgi:hypothetical protein
MLHTQTGIQTSKLEFNAPEELPGPLPAPSEWSPEEITEAREYIRLRLEGINVSKLWSMIRISEPEYVVLCDDRGLMARVIRLLDVARRVGREEITIQESITLAEGLFSKHPSEEELAEDIVNGIGKTEREKALKMARQELQGVMEFFFKVPALAAGWEELDRGTTGILEEVVEEDLECQYCDKKHRNGDCRLPSMEDIEMVIVGEE